jgi:hypothetical protein
LRELKDYRRKLVENVMQEENEKVIERGKHVMFIKEEAIELKEERRRLKDTLDPLPSTDVTNRAILQRKIDDVDERLEELLGEVLKDFENDPSSEFYSCARAIAMGYQRGRDIIVKQEALKNSNMY